MFDSPVSEDRIAEIVRRRIAPDAAAVDRDGVYPRAAMVALGEAGAYARHVGAQPDLVGGVAALAAVSAACLTTGFSVWCQDALALYLDRSPNRALAARLGPPVAIGARLGGTGLSNPMKSFSGVEALALKGERVAGGWRLRGRLPWVSNIAPGHSFAVIVAVENAPPVMALLDCDQPGVAARRSGPFIALEGAETRTVMIRDAFVSDDAVIAEDATRFVPTIRQTFVALQLGMGFGLARGIIAALRADAKGLALAHACAEGPDALEDRLMRLEERLAALAPAAASPERADFHAMLRLRLDASLLALDAARAEMAQAGARGYLAGAAAFRRQREAQFVAIVTPSIKHIAHELAGAG